ncbi:MAG: hypothetical protein KDE31_37280 [Caldilineaceae bacterium]|nr:hypothetical protein [Caldilineaceae bacterium]
MLVTTWRLDEKLHTQLHDPSTPMPVSYLHLTDAEGTLLAQADHPLGERRIELHDEGIVLDLVALPRVVADPADVELRLGLWYPESAQYFWSPTSEADGAGRVRLGNLADFTQYFAPPALPVNSALATTFSNPIDGRSLRLLDAYLTPDPTYEHLQLSTFWEQSNLFIPGVSVTLFAHLTDPGRRVDPAEGALQSEAHLLDPQQLTWHDGYLRFDRFPLPQSWTLDKIDTDQELWIELLYLDSGQRYQADRLDRVDANGRVRLGTVAELLRPIEPD